MSIDLPSPRAPRGVAETATVIDSNGPGFCARVEACGSGVAVVAVGEIDAWCRAELWSVIEQALAVESRLVLDMADTTFIDAAGLGVILRAHRQLGQRREAVVLRSAKAGIRRVLAITGVDQLVTIEDPDGRPTSRARVRNGGRCGCV